MTDYKQNANKLTTSKVPRQVKTVYRLACTEAAKQEPEGLSENAGKGNVGQVTCEAIPSLVPLDVDTLVPVQPKTNAQIVFTKDRPGSRFSGKTSDTRAAAIDIVVGRLGPKSTGENQLVDPNFTDDAARIYISQKSDVDKNFNIRLEGEAPLNDRSAIALKADGIRLIAREGIKIVTGTDKNNSQGGEIKSVYGIELIAGNHTGEVEPMVKGTKLVNALDELAQKVEELNAAVKHGFTIQQEMNLAVQNHFHYSPWYGNPTLTSDTVMAKGAKTSMEHLQQTQRSLTNNRANIAAWRKNNLCESGRDFVLSRFNKLN